MLSYQQKDCDFEMIFGCAISPSPHSMNIVRRKVESITPFFAIDQVWLVFSYRSGAPRGLFLVFLTEKLIDGLRRYR